MADLLADKVNDTLKSHAAHQAASEHRHKPLTPRLLFQARPAGGTLKVNRLE